MAREASPKLSVLISHDDARAIVDALASADRLLEYMPLARGLGIEVTRSDIHAGNLQQALIEAKAASRRLNIALSDAERGESEVANVRPVHDRKGTRPIARRR